jgi:hypothetical protein
MKNLALLIILFLFSCVSPKNNPVEQLEFSTNVAGTGNSLVLEMMKGKAFNHPSMAVWVEDPEGNYLETLFVTQYVAKGVYGHGQLAPGVWDSKPGTARRPATLPYWAHKRNIKASDGLFIPSPENPMPDALSGATPKGNFRLNSRLSQNREGKFRILMEVNQAWDANDFWTNGKFPGDADYYGSLQPSLVYAGLVDTASSEEKVYLNPIGHGHPSGKDGRLFTDLTTLTTAKEIIHSVNVQVR